MKEQKKVYEFFFASAHQKKKTVVENLTQEEILSREKEKIKSAVLTDFILSVEIVIIALGSVEKEAFPVQIIVVSVIALLATIGVYGIVALIVRLDDFGAKLIDLNEEENSFSGKMGTFLVNALPKVIKSLSVIGTIALLLVSGGIFVHNIDYLHGLFENIPSIIVEFLIGLLVGGVVLLLLKLINRFWAKFA